MFQGAAHQGSMYQGNDHQGGAYQPAAYRPGAGSPSFEEPNQPVQPGYQAAGAAPLPGGTGYLGAHSSGMPYAYHGFGATDAARGQVFQGQHHAMDGFPVPMQPEAGAEASCARSCFGDRYRTGSMTQVGAGRGEYVRQMVYKWVGEGQGDLSVLAPMPWYRRCLPCLFVTVALLGLVGLIALAVMMWPTTRSAVASTTVIDKIVAPTVAPFVAPKPQIDVTADPQVAECIVWGDPHLVTFDAARPNFYGPGDHWLIWSDKLKVQARVLGTEWTSGLAATNKVIIGGEAVDGNTIEVGCLDCGPILFNRKPFNGAGYSFNAKDYKMFFRYNKDGQVVDTEGPSAKWERNVLHVHLSNATKVTIFRWKNYIDLRVVMRPSPDLDGMCGNANGDPSDDTTAAVLNRVGAQVRPEENMFSDLPEIKFTPWMNLMLAEKCTGLEREEAFTSCLKALPQKPPPSTALLNSCVFNMCFGKDPHARRTAKAYQTAAQVEE